MKSDLRQPPTPDGHPFIGHTIDFAQSPFDFVDRAIEECGDVYRMKLPSTQVFVLAHPDYFTQALVTEIDAFGKSDDFQTAFGNGVIATEGDQWRRQRGVLQPFFTRKQVGKYSDQMVKATQQRVDTWLDREILDMETEMKNLTLEVLFATLFGRELQPGEGDDLRTAADGLHGWFAPTSWLLPNWVPTLSRHSFKNSKERLRTEIQQLLTEQRTSDANGGSHSETLLSKLHNARNGTGQNQLSQQEVEGMMITMIFAGYETTASALAFAWYALATHPDLQEAFHDEVDTVLDGDSPTQADIDELELTRRILKETMRLYPPIHTIPRKTTRTVDVNGYQLPANEEVHLGILAVHRDERFYDDPLSFQPDRWESDLEDELPEHAYMPFGGGRRACVGREFALLEATLVLATIGQDWEFEWKGKDELAVEPGLTLQTQGGLPMWLKRR
ncbi:cytochrome P450 [Haladaptatus paucihalophilus DX253]|uniref:Cytochrome P450 n=1 Tax=Haladaptatus paucihalophilus DX253 TaxID=797209 RepID=E7QSX0_HALPU|nr:cytochrome P450 [Haladaptatus paucihalophilus]EFW92359.1 cytochrome P450 [Haladaptatus paucihalophilus DX253]SHL61559.1 Cytochrome P450 [Haladaptatus paucihalophilus DX253]